MGFYLGDSLDMKSNEQTAIDAKRTIKSHIKFLKSLVNHIDGDDEAFKSRAMWTAWCLHKYINNQLMLDISSAMDKHGETDVRT